MTHIHLAVFALDTEIVRVAAVTIAMSPAPAVVAVPNAVTLVNPMTLLTTPIAVIQQYIRVGGSQRTNGLSHNSDFAF